MSNHQNAIELVKALSGQANVLTIPRLYIDYMGSIDGGLLLNQLVYWSDKGADSEGWFYKTYLEWEDETTLSKYEVSKQVNILKEKGTLKTKVKKANGAPTVHYKFLFSEFQNSIVKFINYRKSKNLTIESEETRQSLTETTTETTPSKKLSAKADHSSPISLLSEKEIKSKTKGKNFPLEIWEAWLKDEQTERKRTGVLRFLENEVRYIKLRPANDDELKLFEILAIEYEAAGGKAPPKKFPSLETKRLFNEAAEFHNGTLESVIRKAIHKRGKGIAKIVDYINSPEWRKGQSKNGRPGTKGAGRTQSRIAGNSQTGSFQPGNGRTPEMQAKLEAAFAPKPG